MSTREIYYIRYVDDDPEEDGIWINPVTIPRQFFMNVLDAQTECKRLNDIGENRHQERQKSLYEKWKAIEKAFVSLEEAGLSAKQILPYHKREFSCLEFNPRFVIDTIKVVE